MGNENVVSEYILHPRIRRGTVRLLRGTGTQPHVASSKRPLANSNRRFGNDQLHALEDPKKLGCENTAEVRSGEAILMFAL